MVFRLIKKMKVKYNVFCGFGLLMLFCNCGWAHEFNMAYYDISMNESGYRLLINFDKDVIIAELKKENTYLKSVPTNDLEKEVPVTRRWPH